MPPTFVAYDPSAVDVQELWPLDKIRNDPLEIRVRHEELREYPTGPVLRREVIFTSHEFRGEKIRIAGHVALPLNRGPLPAMILGAGGLDAADAFSRAHGVAVLAIDRVGTGDSNGPPDSYNQAWLDLSADMRDGWMVQYVTNTLRGITYLQAQPEVDGARIGITGGSRGGTMCLIANGVDPRITLAVPNATCGDILTAFEHDGWANFLYQQEDGAQGIPPAFRIFSLHGDPIHFARSQHGKVMLILGAQDEYFPIYTVKTYCDAVSGDMRLCLIPDWDHGLFSADRPEVGTYDNREEAGKRSEAAMKYAINCYLHQNREMPHTPLLSWLYREGRLEFKATADTSWPVEHVHLIHSTDGAYFFKRLPMEKFYESFREYYAASLEVSADDLTKLCFYVEARYADGPFLMSPPEFGLGFQQQMRVQPRGEPGPEPQFATEELRLDSAVLFPGAVVSFDRQSAKRPLLIILASPKDDCVPVSEEQLKAEVQRYSRRGLFVAGLAPTGVGNVEALRGIIDKIYGERADVGAASIIGYGRAGAIALESAAQMPEYFRCVVAYSPSCSAEESARLAQVAGNVHATQVRIFTDLEDPHLHVGQRFADAARAAGRDNVAISVSHPTDGLRWSAGWPEDCPVLRRTEERFMRLVTAGSDGEARLPEAGTLVVAPAVSAKHFSVKAVPDAAAASLEYSIRGSELSLRIVPSSSTTPLVGCMVALRGATAATMDGNAIEVGPGGAAEFFTQPSATISARLR